MPARIELVNVTDLAHDLGASKMTQVEQMDWLNSTDIEAYYTIGSGKGGRVMVHPESVARLRELGLPSKERKSRTLKVERATHPIAQPLPAVDMEELETWKASIEEMVLEQEGRVDALHKAVERMTETYLGLRVLVDPSVKMPDPPPLPPKYRYRVVVVGGDERTPMRLGEIFPTIRFLHVHMADSPTRRQRWPKGDFIIFMKNFASHSMFDQARKEYGAENLNIVGGAISGAESVIRLWISEQQKKEIQE